MIIDCNKYIRIFYFSISLLDYFIILVLHDILEYEQQRIMKNWTLYLKELSNSKVKVIVKH